MNTSDVIYLDYNATTSLAPEVAQAMRPFLEGFFGNPSSKHQYGREAKDAVERGRSQVARLLGAHPDEVVFTSGGTEANNMALIGVARAHRLRGNHIITSAIEHPAISEVCAYLAREGFKITTLPVDSTGLVDPSDVERALTSATVLVTIMHANNEVGTLEPISEIAQIAHQRGVIVHSDGAQSVGKVMTHVDELGVDLFSIAGHKLYGPKGIGALYVRRGIRLEKLLFGADHEGNRRPGTENVIHIVGLGRAAELASDSLDETAKNMRKTRDRLHAAISAELPQVHLNGHPEKRLPNTLSLAFPGLEANKLLDHLKGIAASAGAACHSSQVTLSHVLSAMDVPERIAMGTLRLTTGRETTLAQIERAAKMIVQVVKQMQGHRI